MDAIAPSKSGMLVETDSIQSSAAGTGKGKALEGTSVTDMAELTEQPNEAFDHGLPIAGMHSNLHVNFGDALRDDGGRVYPTAAQSATGADAAQS